MSAPKLIDVTPFEPLIIKVHYDGFDWNKLKPICEKMLADAPAMVDLEQNGASSSVSNRDNQPHIIEEFSEFYRFNTIKYNSNGKINSPKRETWQIN